MRDNQPPFSANKEWTPEEKMLWLVSKGAPPHFRLTTVAEINRISVACEAGETRNRQMTAILTLAAQLLEERGYMEPRASLTQVAKAAGQAAFDARRFERATTTAIERIEKTLEFLKLLCEHSQTPVHMIDVASEAAALYETHKFLIAQRDAKWEHAQ
jgi:hypothetical protein